MSGYLLGELAQKTGLPKVSGYIMAGLLLNPGILGIGLRNVEPGSGIVIDTCLAFITFEVGGTLLFPKLKKSGAVIIGITCAETLGASLMVFTGFMILFSSLLPGLMVPLSVLLAALAAPTDPSATLAVTHEYKAKGEVSDTIMEVAAFDDALGIIIYSLAIGIASAHMESTTSHSLTGAALPIGVGVGIGIGYGIVFNMMTSFFKSSGEQTVIVQVLGFLTLCYGTSAWLHGDALLSTMIMGMMVVNFNPKQEEIFGVLERYTENLVFIFFFALSACQLDLSMLKDSAIFIVLFVLLRAIGKYTGVYWSASAMGRSSNVKKYTAGGLIPQGGIVIGLALTLGNNEILAPLADLVISTVMGATLIHEVLGPLIAKATLKKAGETGG